MLTRDRPMNVDIRANATSGFLVFLIALPLSLGIALASGAPPVAGILTAIAGGLVASFLGSAPLTIKGPAAGLIVIVAGAVTELGGGDAALGYRRMLAVGVVAGVVQIALAWLRAGDIAASMPDSVVHGMLAAIGVIIIAKQVPLLLGVTDSGPPLALLLHIPRDLVESNPEVALIGGVALVMLLVWPRLPARLQKVPAPMGVLIFAVPAALWFDLPHAHTYHFAGGTYDLGPRFLVSLPDDLLQAVVFPDFSGVQAHPYVFAKYVVMFSLVGSVESLLSVIAVDAMDPKKRASDLNRDLLSVGVANAAVAVVGGLPMISEIVRSRANVDAGAVDHRANFFHGLFLFCFVVFAPTLLGLIPLAALAAMLVATGLRLAAPSQLRHAREKGLDQLLIFLTTMIVTLVEDLLVGVAAGLALKVVLHVVRGASLRGLLRDPLTQRREGDTLVVTITGSATFLNFLAVRRALTRVPEDVREVVMDFEHATLVDHTFLEKVHLLADEWPSATLRFEGLQRLRPVSEHPQATRRRVMQGA
ncbi:MAG: SulP family inorganic anion transporter [Polyangiales bacterium]